MTAIFALNDRLEDGHYTVLKELGVGGMGVVYHCRDEFLQRDVAIKMLLPELMADSKNVEVFREEARLAARMDHPNIVTVYDIGVEKRDGNEHHFVAMEYLPGGNLANRTQGAALAVEHALHWMKQLSNGLYFAHRKGVVHQDVKADNIFITTEGDLKIGDFGLARLMANKVYINPSTKGMGTPAYMSPELCRGEQQDQRSDIYSLGILFFEMVTGQLPYRANGMIEMAMKHTTAPIPSVRRLNPEVPDVLDRLIRKMMEKTPTDRFQSLNEVLKILDDLIFDMRVARMGLSTKRTSQKVDTAAEIKQEIAKSYPVGKFAQPARSSEPVSPSEKALESVPPPAVESPSSDEKARKDRQRQSPQKDGERVDPVKRPASPFDDRADISHTKLEAAGIKMFEPVGPVREPSQPVAKFDDTSQRISYSYSVPVFQGLEPQLQEKWNFKTEGPIGWNSLPVLQREENCVYVASADGVLYKLDVAGGQLIWKYDSSSMFVSSPQIRGKEILIATVDGAIVKLDAASGAKIWLTRINGRVVARPALTSYGIIVPSMTGQVVSLDINDGGKQWERELKAAAVCSPSVYGDVAFVATRSGDVHSLQVRSGKEYWRANLDGPVVSTPATSADSLYVGTQNGTFYSLDIESGQSVWEHDCSRGIIASPVIVFTSVIFCSQDKWMYSCEKYDGRLRWKSAVKGNVQVALTEAAQTVIAVSREGWMQGFDAEKGHMKWQKNFGRRLESQPLLLKDGMLVASVEGDLTLYAFDAKPLQKKSA